MNDDAGTAPPTAEPSLPASAVLFDFSGTLFHVESAESWLRAALSRLGIEPSADERARWAAALETAGALPGGSAPREVPEALAELWAERDRSAESHREAYTALARRVELPHPALYDALYERHREPDAWRPYPDTAEVLAELRRRGVAVAVVSNIGWDPRPVFREHRVDQYVDAYLLSFEHGWQKPDPRLFRLACATLRCDPRRTLMVGDNAHADGGATALGCGFSLVRNQPVDCRPHGLRPVLDRVVPAG